MQIVQKNVQNGNQCHRRARTWQVGALQAAPPPRSEPGQRPAQRRRARCRRRSAPAASCRLLARPGFGVGSCTLPLPTRRLRLHAWSRSNLLLLEETLPAHPRGCSRGRESPGRAAQAPLTAPALCQPLTGGMGGDGGHGHTHGVQLRFW